MAGSRLVKSSSSRPIVGHRVCMAGVVEVPRGDVRGSREDRVKSWLLADKAEAVEDGGDSAV